MNAAEELRMEGQARGELLGKRGTLAQFLFVRGIKLTACTDGAQLDGWTLRASTANSEADVFGS